MQRRALITCAGLALLAWQRLARGATILAVRLWPAPDYSRITIESDTALKVRTTLVADPPRLAVDIDGVELDSTLRELVTKLGQDDPNIAGIRVGQNAPGVVRLVLDLKQAMAPQVFTLEPVAAYRHRLVFDLYPAQALDPLQALINERLKATSSPDPLGELIARHQAGSAPTPATQASIPTATQKIATTPITTGPRGQNDAKNLPDQRLLISLEPTDRAWLHARIAQRFDAMLAAGLLDEVQTLRARGDLHPDLPSMRCVGYRQAWEALDGLWPMAELRDRGVFATRQLAKRQITWLRASPERRAIPCEAPDALAQVLALARAFAQSGDARCS